MVNHRKPHEGPSAAAAWLVFRAGIYTHMTAAYIQRALAVYVLYTHVAATARKRSLASAKPKR